MSESSPEKLKDEFMKKINDYNLNSNDDNRYADIPSEFLPYMQRERLPNGGQRVCFNHPLIKVDLAKILPPKRSQPIVDFK